MLLSFCICFYHSVHAPIILYMPLSFSICPYHSVYAPIILYMLLSFCICPYHSIYALINLNMTSSFSLLCLVSNQFFKFVGNLPEDLDFDDARDRSIKLPSKSEDDEATQTILDNPFFEYLQQKNRWGNATKSMNESLHPLPFWIVPFWYMLIKDGAIEQPEKPRNRKKGGGQGIGAEPGQRRASVDGRTSAAVGVDRTNSYYKYLIRTQALDILNNTDPASPLFIGDNHSSSLSVDKHPSVGRTVKPRSPAKKNTPSAGKRKADAAPTSASAKKVLRRYDCIFLHCEI